MLLKDIAGCGLFCWRDGVVMAAEMHDDFYVVLITGTMTASAGTAVDVPFWTRKKCVFGVTVRCVRLFVVS